MLTRLLALVLLLLFAATGCESCGESTGPADAAVVAKPPVPAPAGLIAKLVVPAPGRTITGLRDAAGGPTLFLPRSVGGLVTSMFALPLQAAEHFDDNLPVVGALLSSGHLAVALHVRDTARLIAASTKGADAKFTSEKVDDTIFLVPTNKSIRKPRIDATLAVVNGHLVAAESREGVHALGPYLTLTLARENVSGVDLVLDLEREALAEPLRASLAWVKGRLTDMNLPEHVRGLLDVEGTLGTLSETMAKLGGGRVSVTLDKTALVLSADLAVGEQPFEAKAGVQAKRLLKLPDDVLVAASWTESRAQRDTSAARRTATLDKTLHEALGKTWTKENTTSVEEALQKLARGRADTTTMGLRCTGIGLTGLALGGVADRAALDEALVTLIGLHRHEAVQRKLEAANIGLAAKKTRILEVPGDVWRVRLKPKPKKKGEIVEETDLLALVRDDDFAASAGMETVDTLQLLHRPNDERSLETKKPILDAITRLHEAVGDDLWIVLMLDPQAARACAVGKPGGAFAAPIVFGVGPRKDRIASRLEISLPLLRVAAKELGAL